MILKLKIKIIQPEIIQPFERELKGETIKDYLPFIFFFVIRMSTTIDVIKTTPPATKPKTMRWSVSVESSFLSA